MSLKITKKMALAGIIEATFVQGSDLWRQKWTRTLTINAQLLVGPWTDQLCFFINQFSNQLQCNLFTNNSYFPIRTFRISKMITFINYHNILTLIFIFIEDIIFWCKFSSCVTAKRERVPYQRNDFSHILPRQQQSGIKPRFLCGLKIYREE